MTTKRSKPVIPAPRPATLPVDEQRTGRFLELYGEHRGHLYGHILALVGQPAFAEEILQDTSLLLWREFDRFEPGTNFRAWGRAMWMAC